MKEKIEKYVEESKWRIELEKEDVVRLIETAMIVELKKKGEISIEEFVDRCYASYGGTLVTCMIEYLYNKAI